MSAPCRCRPEARAPGATRPHNYTPAGRGSANGLGRLSTFCASPRCSSRRWNVLSARSIAEAGKATTATQRGAERSSFLTGSWKRRFLVAAATAVGVAALVYFPDRNDGSGSILGGISALIPVALALAALEQIRPFRQRSTSSPFRLLLLSLLTGLALGLTNLSINYGMAMADPAIHEQMVTRWAEFSVWSVVFAEPILEEIAYRLVLLTALAWLVSRVTASPRTILYSALLVSGVVFGVAHIFYGGVHTPLYAIGMAVKSSGGGLLLGWVFWRWGFGYCSICHCTANAIHLLLIPTFF